MAKRLVVIDDDEAMRDLFELFLTDEGWEVISYDYAHANLDLVRQLVPDLIILDVNVVRAGAGWEFLQLLKMEDMTAAIPVVICTTAIALPPEIEGYLAARQISIVRKPFDVGAFIVTVQKNFSPAVVLTVLVVEDNADLADNVTTILSLSGYQVTSVSNGLLALNEVTKVRYSLILLDITMPVMNGLEFLAAYERQPGAHSPVVIFSAQTDLMPARWPEFVMGVLEKPFQINRLLELVNKYAKPVLGAVGL